jgi:kynurenine formamidase
MKRRTPRQSLKPRKLEGSGVEMYDLSHPWGHGIPEWPSSVNLKTSTLKFHAMNGMLVRAWEGIMHRSTHMDFEQHVTENGKTQKDYPLPTFFGTGVAVSIPKGKWGVITPQDLENARPKIQEGDIVIVNTGWHKYYGDNRMYYAYSPGFYKEAGEWFAKKKVKLIGTDTQALDHPLGTAIGPHGPGAPNGLLPSVNQEYERETGRRVIDDFPEWEPCHQAILKKGICGIENVGGEIDKVTGMRCTFAAFPWRWTKGDGCIVRLVAMVDPSGKYRIETGKAKG